MKNLMEGISNASRGDVFEVTTDNREIITLVVLKPTEKRVLLCSEQRNVSQYRIVCQDEQTFLVTMVSSKILCVKDFTLVSDTGRVVEAHQRAGFSK